MADNDCYPVWFIVVWTFLGIFFGFVIGCLIGAVIEKADLRRKFIEGRLTREELLDYRV
jgi:hypothetical protein